VILRALSEAQAAGPPPLAFDEPVTVTITAVAFSNGARFTRRAVAKLNTDQQTGPNSPQFLILDWGTGEP
jgi:hypothetical protein